MYLHLFFFIGSLTERNILFYLAFIIFRERVAFLLAIYYFVERLLFYWAHTIFTVYFSYETYFLQYVLWCFHWLIIYNFCRTHIISLSIYYFRRTCIIFTGHSFIYFTEHFTTKQIFYSIFLRNSSSILIEHFIYYFT